ncbi:MAG: deoxyribonuclease IV [Gemmatimonadetes bacterium]|nr:deoxyribonuclease IV [Gemmatimonadota bacterium]
MLLGAHVRGERPLAEAAALGAGCVQLFLGDPQSYHKPPTRPDAAELCESPLPVYVHAPYLINVASPNPRVRVPSRKILAQTLEAAGDIRAAGVIVHAGHAEDGIENGYTRWWKVFEELQPAAGPRGVPLMIENTAGGAHAMGRSVETLARLWERLEDFDVGLCYDTCHAHAAGEDIVRMAERLREVCGGVEVVHANSSRDAAGSGRDRHANFAEGLIEPGAIVAAVRAAAAAIVICETPWKGIAVDLAFLRAELGVSGAGVPLTGPRERG